MDLAARVAQLLKALNAVQSGGGEDAGSGQGLLLTCNFSCQHPPLWAHRWMIYPTCPPNAFIAPRMTTKLPEKSPPPAGAQLQSPQKSKGGPARLWGAVRYSLAGVRAAFKHEAAFRQELALGLPMVVLALWLHPGRVQTLLLVGSVVLVWVVELLNSALEALADAISIDHHPLLGRAKDLGSAAVMLTLLLAAFTWAVLLWPLLQPLLFGR